MVLCLALIVRTHLIINASLLRPSAFILYIHHLPIYLSFLSCSFRYFAFPYFFLNLRSNINQLSTFGRINFKFQSLPSEVFQILFQSFLTKNVLIQCNIFKKLDMTWKIITLKNNTRKIILYKNRIQKIIVI
jgi:hypothetical protein